MIEWSSNRSLTEAGRGLDRCGCYPTFNPAINHCPARGLLLV